MKRIIPFLLLAVLLTGCGTTPADGSGEGAASNAPAGYGTPTADTPQETTVPTQPPEWRERSLFAMDTVMQLKIYGGTEELLDLARERIDALEERISVTLPESEIAQLNRSGRRQLSPGPLGLLEEALSLCRETEGALDVTVYPVVKAWGFTTGDYRVPSAEELGSLLTAVDYTGVLVQENGEVVLPAGAELDLGSVVKGYLGNQLCALLREGGVAHAMLNLGGQHPGDGGQARRQPLAHRHPGPEGGRAAGHRGPAGWGGDHLRRL